MPTPAEIESALEVLRCHAYQAELPVDDVLSHRPGPGLPALRRPPVGGDRRVMSLADWLEEARIQSDRFHKKTLANLNRNGELERLLRECATEPVHDPLGGLRHDDAHEWLGRILAAFDALEASRA